MFKNRHLLALIALLALSNVLACLFLLAGEHVNAGRIAELTQEKEKTQQDLQGLAVEARTRIAELTREKDKAEQDLRELAGKTGAEEGKLRDTSKKVTQLTAELDSIKNDLFLLRSKMGSPPAKGGRGRWGLTPAAQRR